MKYEEIQSMKSKAVSFVDVYRNYYNGNLKDEDILNNVTQSYWQSMYLSKQRMNNLGIVADTEIENDNRGIVETASVDSDGKSSIGTFKQPVKIRKRYYQNGNLIGKKDQTKLNVISVIKSNSNNKGYACPNCGNFSSIESYIDGCDYCGSKFEVGDFDEKVSAFNIEEDTNRKSKTAIKRVFASIGCVLAAMIFIVVAFIALLIINIYTGTEYSDKTGTQLSLVFLGAYKLIPVMFWIGVAFVVIFGFLGLKYLRYSFNRVEKNNALHELKGMVKKFSAEKFASELEYKLRNIHYAEKAEEINAFASFDTAQIANYYTDVIDCNLEKVTFLSSKRVQNQEYDIVFKVRANLALTRFVNGKIKEEAEKVILLITAKEEVLDNDIAAVRMHKCSGCGMNISLLNGGICEYCGNALDYKQYSFIISGYYSNIREENSKVANSVSYVDNQKIIFGNQKVRSITAKLRIKIALFLVAAFALSATIFYLNTKDYLYVLMHYDEYAEIITNSFDEIQKVHDVVDTVELTDEKIDSFTYEYKYKGNLEFAFKNYRKYMDEEGFELFINSPEKKLFYRHAEFGEEIGFDLYQCIVFERVKNEFKVTFEIYEHDDLFEDD